MASFVARVTGIAFASLARVHAGIAADLAFWLFCRTPPKAPRQQKARRAYAEGAALLAASERRMLAAPGGAVASYHLPAKTQGAPRVLVVHGWGSRAENMARLALALQAAGAAVTLIDLPGHGRSAGRMLHLRLAAEAIAAAAEIHGPFDGAAGHSFGGAALMVAAGAAFPGLRAVAFGRLALIGAPTEMESLFKNVARRLRLTPESARKLIERAEHMGRVPLSALDTVPIAERLAVPLLIVHAEDDKEVSATHARRYEAVGGDVRFVWANGFGHRRIVAAPPVLDTLGGFFGEGAATVA